MANFSCTFPSDISSDILYNACRAVEGNQSYPVYVQSFLRCLPSNGIGNWITWYNSLLRRSVPWMDLVEGSFGHSIDRIVLYPCSITLDLKTIMVDRKVNRTKRNK